MYRYLIVLSLFFLSCPSNEKNDNSQSKGKTTEKIAPKKQKEQEQLPSSIPATIQGEEKNTRPINIKIVLDTSSSMQGFITAKNGERHLAAYLQALMDILVESNPDSQIPLNIKLCKISDTLECVPPEKVNSMLQELTRNTAFRGNTNLELALADEFLTEEQGTDLLILTTDGLPSSDVPGAQSQFLNRVVAVAKSGFRIGLITVRLPFEGRFYAEKPVPPDSEPIKKALEELGEIELFGIPDVRKDGKSFIYKVPKPIISFVFAKNNPVYEKFMINTAQKISQKVVSGRDFYVDKNYYVFSFDFYPQEEFTSKTEVFYHEGKCPFTSSLAKKSQVHLENKRLAYQIPFTYLLKSKSSNQEESFLCIKVDASLTNERKKIEHFGVPLLNLHYLKLAPDKSEPQLKPLAVDKIRPFQEKQCTDTTCTWFFQIDFRRLSELYEGGEKFSIAYTLGVNPDNLKTENLIFRDAFFLSNTERKPFELWSSSNEFEYIYRIYNLEYLFKKVFQELHLSVIKDAKSFGQIDLSLVIK